MNIVTVTASPDPERRPSALEATLDDLAGGPIAALIADLEDGPLFAAIRSITGESR